MSQNFEYITKRSPEVRKVYKEVLELIHAWQKQMKSEFTFNYSVVGSYKRNMITYDKKSNVGYDSDFNIDVNINIKPKKIKEKMIAALNVVVERYGYDYAEDSTRVITIKKKDRKKSRIIHSVDFAIIDEHSENGDKRQKYIHFNKKNGTYTWCKQTSGYYELQSKIDWIKKENLWNKLRNKYIQKKNENNDKNIHSRTIFAISIHEICQKYGYLDE